ncbi:hypothetical protein EJ04DRAFT_133164 [Polyplosphaeria fusca]|uniref:Uncharacterized protein n=1 Tax=Polyplosphaeria fusca TaxID=682080 RepID=A0A9P4QHX4_9PLEO|nr:hypothetical protein EJ04DRAFT_133164 [Polyplosphaeria fusca]
MRFSLVSATAILPIMATFSSAFVMETFHDEGCRDHSETVNVWDNSCATWPNAFSSFRITTLGGYDQRAYFFAPDNCGSLPTALISGYVDGRDTSPLGLNQCYYFNGAVANAVSSYFN